MTMDTPQAEITDAQRFETWCSDASLSDSTVSVLKKEGLDDLKILKLLPASEISDLGITKGQALLLRTALKRLAVEDYDEASFTYSGYSPGQVLADGSELRRRNRQDDTDGTSLEELPATASKRKHQLRDLNSFTQRKTVTQGLMDMAMMSANCSQVNVEEADDDDDDDEPNSNLAHKYNNWAMSLTLVIMADNVLISSLGIK